MTNLAITMYNYHVWANQTLFKRLIELPEEVYHQELNSVFPSISHVVSHMYIVDQLWHYIISGNDMPEALEMEKVSGEDKGINEIYSLFNDLFERNIEYLNTQNDFQKVRVLDIPWESKTEITLGEMVMHVVTHGTYHRGNITAMLRQLGIRSVTTDLTSYWFAKKITEGDLDG